MPFYCPQCGVPVKVSDKYCPNCGTDLVNRVVYAKSKEDVIDLGPYVTSHTNREYQDCAQNQGTLNQASVENPIHFNYDYSSTSADTSWPLKDKLVAALLAIFLGDLGIHQFYLGHTTQGILMLVFSWTGIPGIIGLIQGIIYLVQNDQDFMQKNHVRIA